METLYATDNFSVLAFITGIAIFITVIFISFVVLFFKMLNYLSNRNITKKELKREIERINYNVKKANSEQDENEKKQQFLNQLYLLKNTTKYLGNKRLSFGLENQFTNDAILNFVIYGNQTLDQMKNDLNKKERLVEKLRSKQKQGKLIDNKVLTNMEQEVVSLDNQVETLNSFLKFYKKNGYSV